MANRRPTYKLLGVSGPTTATAEEFQNKMEEWLSTEHPKECAQRERLCGFFLDFVVQAHSARAEG